MSTKPHLIKSLSGLTNEQDDLYALLQNLGGVYAISVTLEFTRQVHIGLFHEHILTGMLRTLMEGDLTEQPLLWIRSSENGRTLYQVGDQYHFTIIAANPAITHFKKLCYRLIRLSEYLPADNNHVFDNSMKHVGFYHPVSGNQLSSPSPVLLFDTSTLIAERQYFADHKRIRVRLISPLQMLRAKEERGKARGRARFVHDGSQLTLIFLRRVYDTLADIARKFNITLSRPDSSPKPEGYDIFHIDWEYSQENGSHKPMTGLLGWLEFDLTDVHPAWLDALLIAQRLGVGQWRSFGWGGFRLETRHGAGIMAPRRPLKSLSQLASSSPYFQEALQESLQADDAPGHYPPPQELARLSQSLKNNDCPSRPLQGHLLASVNGKVRPLAVPCWEDRLWQRAVAKVLNNSLETIFNSTSFGYRRGRSRYTLKEELTRLYRDGYRYFFEADIHGFFDHIAWDRIHTRLAGLFGDDETITQILAWISSPVQYQEHLVERSDGLPQGSPLSPVLANMLLEDFDADCASHGLKLLRYADDFVILCRSETTALSAWRQAEQSISELGLQLKPEKTGIGQLDQASGLEFLGFRFVGDLVVETDKSTSQPPKVKIPEKSWLAQLLRLYPDLESSILNIQSKTPPKLSLPTQTDTASQENITPNVNVTAVSAEQGSVLCLTEPVLLTQRKGRLHVVSSEKGGRNFVWHELEAVLIFNHAQVTSGVINAALDAGVVMHFLDPYKGYRGRVIADHSDNFNVETIFQQKTLFSEHNTSLQLSIQLVRARIHNQRETLRQRLRTQLTTESQSLLNKLQRLMQKCAKAQSRSSLNGYEGVAARYYFQGVSLLLPDWVSFSGRNRQPPKDPFNVLLSLGYSVVYARTVGLIHVSGLHPKIGFYHQNHGSHAVLASDMMEPFRHLVERTACSMLKRREIQEGDFSSNDQGACIIGNSAKKRYLTQLGNTLTRTMTSLESHHGDYYQLMLSQLKKLKSLSLDGDISDDIFFRAR